MSFSAKPLPKSFYMPSAVDVAPALLGKVLVHINKDKVISGIIIETEAYTEDDPACHAHRGKTPRNSVMFGPPGRAYVYKVHMQNCINAVCRPEGFAEAVLIRALYPLEGKDIMAINRGTDKVKSFCSGPGKLCAALGIDRSHNGLDLGESSILITNGEATGEIVQTTRIGISCAVDYPWRFYLKKYEGWVSKKASSYRP